jgi:hypothetical protein
MCIDFLLSIIIRDYRKWLPRRLGFGALFVLSPSAFRTFVFVVSWCLLLLLLEVLAWLLICGQLYVTVGEVCIL